MSPSHFPNIALANSFRAQIVPATVIRLPSSLTTTPKLKLFLIANIDPLLMFIINSDIFEYYRSTTHRALPYQVPILQSDNSFLSHDSYIDCWKFWEEYEELDDIISFCCIGEGTILGQISEATALRVVDSVCDCLTFSNPDRERVSRGLLG